MKSDVLEMARWKFRFSNDASAERAELGARGEEIRAEEAKLERLGIGIGAGGDIQKRGVAISLVELKRDRTIDDATRILRRQELIGEALVQQRRFVERRRATSESSD